MTEISFESNRPEPIIIPNRDESIIRATHKTCDTLESMEICLDYSSDEDSTMEISPLSLTSSTTSSPPPDKRKRKGCATIVNVNNSCHLCSGEIKITKR